MRYSVACYAPGGYRRLKGKRCVQQDLSLREADSVGRRGVQVGGGCARGARCSAGGVLPLGGPGVMVRGAARLSDAMVLLRDCPSVEAGACNGNKALIDQNR